MTRKTRNSQRAASGVIAPVDPPTRKPRKRPSKTAPAGSAVPFPTVDNTIQQPEQKTPSPRRRSAGLVSRPARDASLKPAAIPISPPAPTTPSRRPATGSKAELTISGNLMPPAPVDDNVEEVEDKGEDLSSHDTEIRESHRILNRKYKEVPELKNIQDIYWKSGYRVVQSARGVRPTRQEQVEYYQENEWDTDEEEYPDAAPSGEREEWAPERSPYELFKGVSQMRNMKIEEKFKRAISKHLKLRVFEFPAPNEGPKIRLAEDTGKGQVWVGVAESPKQSPSLSSARAVRVNKNGEPLYDDENEGPTSSGEIIADINAAVHPSTGLLTAEYLESQLDDLMHEAELTEKEYQAMEGRKATVYGELLIEEQELEEEILALDALWKRLKAIVDPDFYEALQRCTSGKKPKIKEPFLAGEPKDISWSSDEEEEGENAEGEEEDDSTDIEEDGEDADEEMDPEIDPLVDGSDSSDANEEEGEEEDQANTGLSTGIADTTGDKLEQARRRPKPLTREKNMDAATLAELIASSNLTAVAPANTTATTSASTNTTTTNQDDGEGENADDSLEEKLPTFDASADAKSFVRDLLGEPNRQSTPPRVATTILTSNENENATEHQRQEEESARARPAFEIYTGPSLPLDDAKHDRLTHQVKKECIEVVLRDQAQGESYNWDEFYEDEASKKKQGDKKVAEVVGPVVPQFDIWVKRENEEFDAAREVSDSEDEGKKNVPKHTLCIRESVLKRSRDEESGSDVDENEESGIASKKRRFSGSYGTSDEQTPVASAPQAERTRNKTYETDEANRNRPSSNTPENSDADDREEEDHVESILSAVSPDSPSPSPAGSPISLGGLPLISPTSREISAPGLEAKRSFAPSSSLHAFPMVLLPTRQFPDGPFSGGQFRTMRGGPSSAVDVEMSDASDEDTEDVKAGTRHIPPALAPAPVSPRTSAPANFGRRGR